MKGPKDDIKTVWDTFVSLGLITKTPNKVFKKEFSTKKYWRVVHLTWSGNGLWTSLNVHGVLYESYFQFAKINFINEKGHVLTGKVLILGKLLIEYGCLKLKRA